ncbi:MAG TPA: DNA-binding response regulator [Alcanivorax sp.]|jgi:two-component system response regulator QseB|uniref:Transcriptional regulatory protein n=1 Tax=Alcanivorax jadensis T9 TaxID=1177181 RepID=A0ABR4W9I2_9GAMM|nr:MULTISPECIES: response regulator transcription factor [Alcanivorax]KGD59917.1 transcriptional regulatory protein [Alcanivorax jadensis T9]MAC13386.1 DNA-binding response regulator [Alcanivorax sp.]MBG32404.1 DNA-binding response regulator [Alcanivorax sp.]MBP20814.1 DNA-binding response regulator [Alcanivorax sp.]MDF1637056.1 response regulator transcription factor [Alcanivorax jadensis]|tara:strand:- start:988 stop:1653 length:666 start_codon:yes stop_codon:yes gene_type:complete
MRLLLVEDDALLADGLQRALRAEGYTVDHIDRGDLVMPALEDGGFALVLLDLGLPGLEGLAALKALRQQDKQIPVIIISAKDALEDRISGLDSGADDYLVKPFSSMELIARIRARLRRREAPGTETLKIGELEIDAERFLVTLGGEPVNLSRREMSVLLQLVRHRGRVLTRDQLEQGLYGWNEDVESNALEVHIHHLRKKLGSGLIRTVRGVGYSLAGETG